MSGIRSLTRRPSQPGYATAGSAPIRVDDTSNKIKIIVAGSGTTEVELQDSVLTSLTANTTVSAATHGLVRSFVLNKSTGATVTLPAATGSGASYVFYIGTALGSGNYIIQVASATDYMRGVAWTTQDGGDTALSFDTADTGTVSTESDTITLNGGTTGGVVGTCVEVRDIASAVWFVELQNKATGSEATPFSVAV